MIFTLHQFSLTQNDNIKAFQSICEHLLVFKTQNPFTPPPKNTIRPVYIHFGVFNRLSVR